MKTTFSSGLRSLARPVVARPLTLGRDVRVFDGKPGSRREARDMVENLKELASMTNSTPEGLTSTFEGGVAIDTRVEAELLENGFRSTRRTKIVCTIGPASSSDEMLERLMELGMNVVRLNMTHGTHDWHRDVIHRVRAINKRRGFSVAIMVDTEGSEVHTTEAREPIKLHKGDHFIFTVRQTENQPRNCLGVSYDAFVDDVEVGDIVYVDGGMVTMQVIEKAGPDVLCECLDPGMVLSRANITFRRKGHIVRARNALLPVITAKDWSDIDFAIQEQVDMIAISFVKSSDVVKNLKSYINARSPVSIEVIAKIESFDSVPNLRSIILASDAIMVARGDLGAQVPIHDVPALQRDIVYQCRQLSKPVIIASHLLQSMIEFPTPTRAEVADISDLVRQRADAALLSAETAIGQYPDKAVDTLRSVMTRIEEWVRQEKFGRLELGPLGDGQDTQVSDQLCRSASDMANSLGAAAIFVYTRRGYMARFLSRYRPDCPIFAFTPESSVRRRLNVCWGVMPFRLDFSGDPEENVDRTFRLMLARGLVKPGDLVVVLSDLGVDRGGTVRQKEGQVRSIQIRRVADQKLQDAAAAAATALMPTLSSAAEAPPAVVVLGPDGNPESLKDRLLRQEREREDKEKAAAAAKAKADADAAAIKAKDASKHVPE